ncbi:MAG: aryl-sulfate sulfotransferase [Flavobacteriaceae bacterium]
MMRRIALCLLFLGSLSCSKESTPTYTLSVQATPADRGQVKVSSDTFEANTPLTITAQATEGNQFSHWSGDASGSTNPLLVSANDNLSITAHFVPSLQTEVEQFNGEKVHDGYVFAIQNGSTQTHLLNKSGEKIHTWTFASKLGNDIEWLPNGHLLGIFKQEGDLPFSFGGYGGILREFDSNQNLVWEYEQADADGLLHHDLLKLPNGNVLSMIWETVDTATAQAAGANVTHPIYPEKIVEINPGTNAIVWQWRAMDHLVQNHNPEAANYGIPSENIQKIDINHALRDDGDIMHANGLAYDKEKDLIYMSVNFYSEVWVIDHSKNTETTAGNAGDLVYRFGNPAAFGHTEAPRLFNNNHHPHLIPETGTIMLYNNGSDVEQSTALELKLPDSFSLTEGPYTPPEIVWSYTDSELFFGKISGAVRLSNGNTLICEGDFGYWEVTPEGEVVWKYGSETNVWRGYGIEANDPRLNLLPLN